MMQWLQLLLARKRQEQTPKGPKCLPTYCPCLLPSLGLSDTRNVTCRTSSFRFPSLLVASFRPFN